MEKEKNSNLLMSENEKVEKKQYFGLFRQIAEMPIGIEHRNYYDSVFSHIYDHYSYPISWEIEFYTSIIPSRDSSVLEIGCGSGRITIPLINRGYHVDALDLSTSMLENLSVRLQELPQEIRDRCNIIHANIFNFMPTSGHI